MVTSADLKRVFSWRTFVTITFFSSMLLGCGGKGTDTYRTLEYRCKDSAGCDANKAEQTELVQRLVFRLNLNTGAIFVEGSSENGVGSQFLSNCIVVDEENWQCADQKFGFVRASSGNYYHVVEGGGSNRIHFGPNRIGVNRILSYWVNLVSE